MYVYLHMYCISLFTHCLHMPGRQLSPCPARVAVAREISSTNMSTPKTGEL